MAPVNKKQFLSKLYKKTYSTPQKLLAEAKKTLPSMKLRDVENFLHEQPDYLRTTKMSYRKYPHSLILRHIVVSQPFQELFIDTYYLKSRASLTTHFCFVIICGFTKFLWVRFSNVLTAAAATNAIKSVVESLPARSVQSVASDRGVEFHAGFSRYLASKSISQIFMTGPNKTSVAERIIRQKSLFQEDLMTIFACI